jgi:hypothetical protein
MQPAVTIRFERGSIIIRSPIFCPKEFTIQYFSKDGATVQKEEKRVFEYVGGGWHFQADEVVRCVREGRLESKLWGHDKSILQMTVFDEVCSSTSTKMKLICCCRFVVKEGTNSLPVLKRKNE